MKIFLKYIGLTLEGCLYLILLGLFFVTFEYGLTYRYLLLMSVALIFLISGRLLFFKILKPEIVSRRRRFNFVFQVLFWAVLSFSLLFPIIPEQLQEEYMAVFLWIAIICVFGFIEGLVVCKFVVPWYTQIYIVSIALTLFWQNFKIFTDWHRSDAVSISFPFKDEWFVVQGGSSVLINHHYHIEAQRFSIDLVKASDLASRHDSDSYASFGSRVYAPSRGRIVAVVDDLEDDGVSAGDSVASAFGNHIIIQQEGRGLYILLAHLMKNSVHVEVGSLVDDGDLIAKCGNSGNSSQPHLHLQIQSSPHVMNQGTTTFPIVFEEAQLISSSIVNLGARPVRRGDVILSND